MDMHKDYDVPKSHYEEMFLEDWVNLKSILSLKPYYDALAVNFEPFTAEKCDKIVQVAQKEYHVVLYIKPRCPYCIKVMKHLEKIGETIPIKDVSTDHQAYQELINVGHKQQVPCLFINGQAHYESAWIIKWLTDNKGKY